MSTAEATLKDFFQFIFHEELDLRLKFIEKKAGAL